MMKLNKLIRTAKKHLKKDNRNKLIAALAIACLLYGTLHSPARKSEEYIRSRVVVLQGDLGGCSGIQINAPSGKDYILTAAHCQEISSSDSLPAAFDDERPIPRKIVEIDKKSDLMLLEGLPNRRGIDIASSSPLQSPLSAFTHGQMLPTHRANGEYLGEKTIDVMVGYVIDDEDKEKCLKRPINHVELDMYCVMEVPEMVSTLRVEPGSSGGPVVNSRDELVGIVSAGGPYFSYMVRLIDIKSFIAPY